MDTGRPTEKLESDRPRLSARETIATQELSVFAVYCWTEGEVITNSRTRRWGC